MCVVCTKYVAQYFCRLCNTQSQKLRMQNVMDDETIPMEVQGGNNFIPIGRVKEEFA